jgi:hypothetical protein
MVYRVVGWTTLTYSLNAGSVYILYLDFNYLITFFVVVENIYHISKLYKFYVI